MSNMSYCRFQNTALDFADCLANLRTLDPDEHHPNNAAELDSRRRLIEGAADMLEAIGVDIDRHELDQLLDAFDIEPPEFNPDEE